MTFTNRTKQSKWDTRRGRKCRICLHVSCAEDILVIWRSTGRLTSQNVVAMCIRMKHDFYISFTSIISFAIRSCFDRTKRETLAQCTVLCASINDKIFIELIWTLIGQSEFSFAFLSNVTSPKTNLNVNMYVSRACLVLPFCCRMCPQLKWFAIIFEMKHEFLGIRGSTKMWRLHKSTEERNGEI